MGEPLARRPVISPVSVPFADTMLVPLGEGLDAVG
jgi:hypothetical protein